MIFQNIIIPSFVLVLFLFTEAYIPTSYPPYCSKGDLTKLRAIPQLSQQDAVKVSKLKQVQVLIRHGGLAFSLLFKLY